MRAPMGLKRVKWINITMQKAWKIIIALQNIIVHEKKCKYGRMYNCVCKKKQCKKKKDSKILFHHSGFPCLFSDLFMQIPKFLHMS